MEYRDDVKLDRARVRYGGGGGGGGGRRSGGRGMAVGGGIGGVIVLVLVLLFGGNIGDVLGGAAMPNDTQQQPQGEELECQTAADIEANRDCRFAAYDIAVQDYWNSLMQGYEYGSMVLFSGQVQTACGTGSSQMGPFYCPGDYTVYIDGDYMGQLLEQLGAAGGDAAELYIVGHEYGHHVSNLTGQMQQARAGGNQTGPSSNQVRLELQADCYAGVFFNNTLQDPNSPIKTVTRDDLMRIADAARAVGDDHIQEISGGRVVPESWTHGSSEMRQRWVAKGYDSGDPNVCDTFATNDL